KEALALLQGGRLDGTWPQRYLSHDELRAIRDWIGSSEAREQSERLRLVRERRRARITAVVTSITTVVLAGLGAWALYLKSRADNETNKAQIALARSAVQDGTKLLEGKDGAEP